MGKPSELKPELLKEKDYKTIIKELVEMDKEIAEIDSELKENNKIKIEFIASNVKGATYAIAVEVDEGATEKACRRKLELGSFSILKTLQREGVVEYEE